MVLELSREGLFVFDGLIELQDPIGLEIHGYHLEVHVVRNEIVQKLHIPGKANRYERHQDYQLHGADHAPESAHYQATTKVNELTYNIMLKTTLLELNESIQPCIFKPSLSRVLDTPIENQKDLITMCFHLFR